MPQGPPLVTTNIQSALGWLLCAVGCQRPQQAGVASHVQNATCGATERHAGVVVFFANDLGSWLAGAVADAGSKKLATIVSCPVCPSSLGRRSELSTRREWAIIWR
jgi:hypothetical protein